MTPLRDGYLVRLPVGSAAGFESSFAELPKSDRLATWTVATKKGDTAERLARAHGISEVALIGFNPRLRRLKSGRLAPGQMLLVPTADVAAAAVNVPDPSIEKFPKSTGKLKVHTVARGESVGAIAKKFGTTSERIMKLNGLKKPMIFPGQTLIVSGKAVARGKGKASRAKSSTGKGKSKAKR